MRYSIHSYHGIHLTYGRSGVSVESHRQMRAHRHFFSFAIYLYYYFFEEAQTEKEKMKLQVYDNDANVLPDASRERPERLRQILKEIKLNKEALDKSIEEYAAFVTQTGNDSRCSILLDDEIGLDLDGQILSSHVCEHKNVKTATVRPRRQSNVSNSLRKFLYEEAGMPDSFDEDGEPSLKVCKSTDSSESQLSFFKQHSWTDFFGRIPGSQGEIRRLEKKTAHCAKEFSGKLKSIWLGNRDESTGSEGTSDSSKFMSDESSNSFFQPRVNSLDVRTKTKIGGSNSKPSSRRDQDRTETTGHSSNGSKSKLSGKIVDFAKAFVVKMGNESHDIHKSDTSMNVEKAPRSITEAAACGGATDMKSISLKSVLEKPEAESNDKSHTVNSACGAPKARTVMSVVSNRPLRKRIYSNEDTDDDNHSIEAYYSLPDVLKRPRQGVENKNGQRKTPSRKVTLKENEHRSPNSKRRADSGATQTPSSSQRRPSARSTTVNARVLATGESKVDPLTASTREEDRQPKHMPSRKSKESSLSKANENASSAVRKPKQEHHHSPSAGRRSKKVVRTKRLTEVVSTEQPLESTHHRPKKVSKESNRHRR